MGWIHTNFFFVTASPPNSTKIFIPTSSFLVTSIQYFEHDKEKKSNQEMLGENLLKDMIALGSLGAALLVQAQPISVKQVTNVEITDSVRGGYIAGIVILSIAAAVLLGIVIVLAYSNSRVYKADSDDEEDEEEFTHMGPGQGEHDEEEEYEEGEEAEGEGEEAEETQ